MKSTPTWIWYLVIFFGFLSGYLMGSATKRTKRSREVKALLPLSGQEDNGGWFWPNPERVSRAPGFDVLAYEKGRTITLLEKEDA